MSNTIKRKDFSKVSSKYPLPNLIEVQRDSFRWFVSKGLWEVFNDIFPIESNNENLLLEFVDCRFDDIKRTDREARDKDLTYSSALKVRLRLSNRSTGAVTESEVFMGDFPQMTPGGTFIINGAERVIVSQLVRSPGAYFRRELDKNGRYSFHADIIPSRGTWLEYESDNKDTIGVRVDRTRRIPATILFKALGIVSNEEIINLFGPHPLLLSTLNKDTIATARDAMIEIFNKIRAGEVPTEEGSKTLIVQKFFDPKRYDLASAGRFKINKKLSLYGRLLNRIVAEDIYDLKGKVLIRKGTYIDSEKLNLLRSSKIFDITKNIINDAKVFRVYQKDTRGGREKEFDLLADDLPALINHILLEDINDKDGKTIIHNGTLFTLEVLDQMRDLPITDIDKTSFRVKSKPQDVTKGKVITINAYTSNDYQSLMGYISAEDIFSKDGELLHTARAVIDDAAIARFQKAQLLPDFSIPHRLRINANIDLDEHTYVQRIFVYSDNDDLDDNKISVMIAPECEMDVKHVTIADMVSTFSYFLNILDGFGQFDDIDNLGNRRIRSVGELIQNQFRVGLTRVERTIREKMSLAEATVTARELINIRPLTAAIKEFFSSSQLSQFMDQTNPLAELTNKRRLSALGPGGLSRDRAGFDVRDVHHTHYGRICPIETPEGPNIGLINNLATYARINEYGFIETPYRQVDKKHHRVTENVDYLSADREAEFVIAQANVKLDEKGTIIDEFAVARHLGENILAPREDVDYIDVSPKQIVSVATACIPFLENDDSNRALMGANMQRQAIPLLRPHAPLVGTGMEHIAARDSGAAVVADKAGVVEYIDSKKITIRSGSEKMEYPLLKFARSNHGTCMSQNALVKIGDKVNANDIIADGPAMERGDLALGQNVVVAFMTWHGYNYEDAVIMSERLVKEDVYTSLHIEEYDCECRDTKLGPEEITKDIPNISDEARAHLDMRGIVIPGTEVKEGDILVGKITPKGLSEPTPEEKLLMSIFGEKSKEGKDNSLRVPHGGAGTILGIKVFNRTTDDLQPGVNEIVRVYIIQKRKISEGDKMAGRHGNKGVISKILPVEDMPFLADGTPVDIMLNPLGVPSRMNIGQVLEIHLGMAAKKLGLHIASPVFDGVTNQELLDLMAQAGMDADGKTHLYDGRTGEAFAEKISVGVMYMIKLAHMVDDKLHARATGPYSLVTQQPLGGKAQNGGQRFGEMEVWALEAYGAAHTLQEIDTIKSDDMIGRAKTYEAIIKGRSIPRPGIPESFKVMIKEFQSLGLDVRLLDHDQEEIDMNELMKQAQREERRISQSIREMTSQEAVDQTPNAVDSYDDKN